MVTPCNLYFPVNMSSKVHSILSLTKPVMKLHPSTSGFPAIFWTSCHLPYALVFYYSPVFHLQTNSHFLPIPCGTVSMHMHLSKQIPGRIINLSAFAELVLNLIWTELSHLRCIISLPLLLDNSSWLQGKFSVTETYVLLPFFQPLANTITKYQVFYLYSDSFHLREICLIFPFQLCDFDKVFKHSLKFSYAQLENRINTSKMQVVLRSK